MYVRPFGFDSRLECLRSTSILVHRNLGGPQKLDYLAKARFVGPSGFKPRAIGKPMECQLRLLSAIHWGWAAAPRLSN